MSKESRYHLEERPLMIDQPRVDDMKIVDWHHDRRFDSDTYSRLLDNLFARRRRHLMSEAEKQSHPDIPAWKVLSPDQPVRALIRGDVSHISQDTEYEARLQLHYGISQEITQHLTAFLADTENPALSSIDPTSIRAVTGYGTVEVRLTTAQLRLLEEIPEFSDIFVVEILTHPNLEKPALR